MDDQQLLRYSRHLLLPQIDAEGQARLLASRALLIGLGGLGSPAAMYLAAAGVGRLVIADFDRVDLSNLQRQIIHDSGDLGRPKAESAADTLHRLNAGVEVTPIGHRLEGEELWAQVRQADVVIDASDNFDTRYTLNEVCVQTGTPLVSGAAIRMEGQVSLFPNDGSDAPCYRCLYRDGGELQESCSENGVLAPLVGVIGSLQAAEAIKVLLGVGRTLTGRLLLVDLLNMEFRTIALRRDPQCPVCCKESIRECHDHHV